jgi:hypothetical protein
VFLPPEKERRREQSHPHFFSFFQKEKHIGATQLITGCWAHTYASRHARRTTTTTAHRRAGAVSTWIYAITASETLSFFFSFAACIFEWRLFFLPLLNIKYSPLFSRNFQWNKKVSLVVRLFPFHPHTIWAGLAPGWRNV